MESRQVLEIVHQVRDNGVTVVWIEHILMMMHGVDRVLVLDQGGMVICGGPQQVNTKAVMECYLGTQEDSMRSEFVPSVRHLNVHYGDFQAIWDVSLDIAAGTTASIIGSNGAGKSTLLKTIAGALRPSRGEVIFREDINSLTPYQTLPRGLALVPEGRRIFPRLSVRENLLIGAYTTRARKNRKPNLEKVCQLFPPWASVSISWELT